MTPTAAGQEGEEEKEEEGKEEEPNREGVTE